MVHDGSPVRVTVIFALGPLLHMVSLPEMTAVGVELPTGPIQTEEVAAPGVDPAVEEGVTTNRIYLLSSVILSL